MKNFVRVFFTSLCMFISLCASAYSMDNHLTCINSSVISAPQKNITLRHEETESSIATTNNQNYEISNLNDKNDTYSGFTIGSVSESVRLTEQILISKYNKNIYAQSHNISPNFKNEICTRAP